MAVATPRRRRSTRKPATRCELCNLRRSRGEDELAATLGFEVVQWCETYLVHGPGDVQGSPYRIDDELAHFLAHAYEVDDSGRRLNRRAYLSRPKGRAKTELAGAIAAAELVGPVRCDGFDAEGRPVGRPIVAPQVLCFATEEGQAGTTYSTAAYMLGEGEAANEYPLDVGRSRTLVGGGGIMLPETSGASSADGARTTFGNFDETHLWTKRELRDLHATVRRNLGKRAAAEPWSLETSTMFRPGDESVAEGFMRTWRRIVAGELTDDGLLVDHRQAPEVELDDDDGLESALREVYGAASEWIDVPRIIAEIRDPQSDPADSRRYWLNQPHRSSDAWLERDELEAFASLAAEVELVDGTSVVLGFDGSLSDDATALVGFTLDRETPPHLFVAGVWESPEDVRGRSEWVVDRAAVNAAVAHAFERLDVILFYGDPAYWTPELAAWSSEWGDDVVREYPTSRDYRMGPATAALHTAITMPGELTHDGHASLVRHAANARTRGTRYGSVLRKDRPTSQAKIDLAVASVIAFAARSDAIAGNLDIDRRRRRRRRREPSKLVTF